MKIATLLQTLRYALRNLRQSPAFALSVVATLGIGIGLNVAIFTVVDCVLLRPLGYHDADRIVAVQTHLLDLNRSIPRLGGDDYTDLAHQVKGLEATAYYQSWADGVQLNGEALYLPVAFVSPGFASVMGVQPVAGRNFQADDAAGHDAVVSAPFAREHFGSPQAALGHAITSHGLPHAIIGVMPDGFSFPDKSAIWMEAPIAPDNPNRTSYNDRVIAKRRAGVTPAQLAAELAAFSRQLQNTYSEDRQKTIETVPLQEQIVGKIRPTLRLLMASVAIILLIVCANVTHLQLVRATRQQRSITIRAALGASRTALATSALLEAVLLAAAGCIAAIVLAEPALRLLVRLAPPDVPRLADVHLNLDVLLFAFLCSAALMAVTAMLPVWRFWHIDPASALRQDASRGMEGRHTVSLRNGLIIGEVALTLTLSVSAILLTRQLIAQSQVDLGFSPEDLITLDAHAVESTPLPSQRELAEATPLQVQAYLQPRLTRLDASLTSIASVPGVLSTAAIDGAPMGFGGSDVSYAVRGRQVFGNDQKLPDADLRPVTPGFFETMQIPLVHGRPLSVDDRAGAPMVLLINQQLAQEIFPGKDPIGQQIMCGYDEDKPTWWTIVGVVGNIHDDSPAAAPTPTFYVPVAQHPGAAADMQIVVRTRGDAGAMLQTLRTRLRQAHPEIAVQATTMRENIGDTQRAQHFRMVLFCSFAAVSILLAAVGMYGVTAYSVGQRRFEFALRMAIGADRGQVLRMVLRKTLTFATLGVAIGIALSVSLTHLLASIVGKLPAFDAAAYALAVLGVTAIAAIAALLPARAASRVEPMSILRMD